MPNCSPIISSIMSLYAFGCDQCNELGIVPTIDINEWSRFAPFDFHGIQCLIEDKEFSIIIKSETVFAAGHVSFHFLG